MRTFLILAFFTSTIALAQVDPGTGLDGPCTEATVTTGAVEYNCSSLTIGAGNHVFPSVAGQIVRIKVTGDVNISSGAVLVLSGGDGAPASGPTPDFLPDVNPSTPSVRRHCCIDQLLGAPTVLEIR